jgi:hypothetical protein
MGKLKNGYLGTFSGTLGPAVGSSWKGISVIRSRPPRKRRHSSKDQLIQSAKMRLIAPFVQPLTGLLNRSYGCVTFQMSCYNKAVSLNLRNAITGEYPDLKVNYPLATLGVGDLLNPKIVSVVSASAGKLTINWSDNSGEGSARATDRAFVAVYCETLNEWATEEEGPQRNAGSYTLDLTAFSGKAVHAYIGFLSAEAQFVSSSLYAGLLDIL